jgi:two-component system, LytTR family, sensor kinase
LTVEVSDSGPAKPATGESNGHGIGLANVRDRLAARFGSEGRLEAGPNPEGGWRAAISLPQVRS